MDILSLFNKLIITTIITTMNKLKLSKSEILSIFTSKPLLVKNDEVRNVIIDQLQNRDKDEEIHRLTKIVKDRGLELTEPEYVEEYVDNDIYSK